MTVLDEGQPWEADDPDPSRALSTYTMGRLLTAIDDRRIELVGNARVDSVDRDADGGFAVELADGRRWVTAGRPVLATGFTSSLRLVADLFDWSDDTGFPALNCTTSRPARRACSWPARRWPTAATCSASSTSSASGSRSSRRDRPPPRPRPGRGRRSLPPGRHVPGRPDLLRGRVRLLSRPARTDSSVRLGASFDGDCHLTRQAVRVDPRGGSANRLAVVRLNESCRHRLFRRRLEGNAADKVRPQSATGN